MSNHIATLLKHWHGHKDTQQWVLATIYDTQGSAYRKIGSQMLINDLGQYFGLLSGGCLESDIMNQARRCWESQQSRLIQYDMQEEEDLAWRLGIGCGGLVKILLQPVNASNQYLDLLQVERALQQQISCCYEQQVATGQPLNKCIDLNTKQRNQSELIEVNGQTVLRQIIRPPVHLAIVGGGVDARPVSRIASELGWQVTLVDPRTSYARAEHFATVDRIVKQPLPQLLQGATKLDWLQHCDAIILMSHNVEIDAQGLQLSAQSAADYVGVLGPMHRTQRVFEHANMLRDSFAKNLANPIGLRLGGDLPESIALSMIAEIHAFMEQQNGLSISGIIEQ